MWWLLLITAAFADAASLNFSNSSEDLATSDFHHLSTEDLKLLQSKLDEITNDYLEHFVEAQSQQVKRQKREISVEKSTLLADRTGVYRLQALKPLIRMCSPALKIAFIDVYNITYAVCIEAMTHTSPARAVLGYISDTWREINSWYVGDPKDVALLYDAGIINILIADSQKAKGMELMRYNLYTQKREFDHRVTATFATAVAIWKMKNDGAYHMAVANSNGKDSIDSSSRISISNWMGTYFDEYSVVFGYDVRDIEPYHIHGNAYLAVANFRRGLGNFRVDSEIYKYNLDQNVWLSHQKIRTHQAMDLEFFTLGKGTGKEFFLAVANNGPSNKADVSAVIYKFVKDIFVPFQCLETYGTTSISSVTDGQKFLLALSNEDTLHLYQYDGWRFVQAGVQYTQTLSSNINDLSFHFLAKSRKLVLAISDPVYTAEYSLFEVEFVHENSLGDWNNASKEWCESKLEYLDNPTIAGLENFQDVFFTDQMDPITITGDLHFGNGFEAAKVTTPKFVDSSKNVYDNSVLLKLKVLDERLRRASERIKVLQEVFNKALKLNGSQTAFANYEFLDVTFQCQNHPCVFTNVTTTMLNGEDLSNLKSNLIFLDEARKIPASLTIQKVNATNVYVHGLVDGMNVSDLVTKSGNHEIIGHKTFKKTIHASEIEVSGFVDGIEISPKTVLLRTGHQVITGNLTFNHLITQWLEVTGLLNGRSLSKFYQDIVLTEGSYTITGKKEFADLSVDNLQMNIGAKINGIDVADLYDNVLWKEGVQTIRAPMTFSSLSLEKDLIVQDVNGLQIPGPRVLLIDENATISAPQTFQKQTSVFSLFVKNSINSIGVNNATGELDILLKTGHQIITGQKTFHTIVLHGDSFVGGRVDGVDLSEFYDSSIRKDKPVESQSPWIFKNLVVKGPLTVDGTVSGVNLNDVYENAVKLNDSDLPNYTFTGYVYIDHLMSHDVNGMDVSIDLVQVDKNQVISGTKTFQHVILKENSSVLGLINNVNISFLSDTLLKIGNQVITSKKTLGSDVKFNSLTINGKINDIPFDEIVTLGGDEIITGTKIFGSLTADNITVKNMEVGGLVNGIKIDDLVNDTMTYEGSQTVTGTKTIAGTIKITNGSNLETKSLNDISISELWSDSVLVDIPQNISGHKSFTAPVVLEDLLVHGSIDNITEFQINDWMLQGVDQTVRGSVSFLDQVTTNNAFVNGYINGINITKLNETIVKTNEPAFIKGPVIFEAKVHSYGDITLSGKIEGIDLSEESVLKTKENVITASKMFTGDVIVDDNLFVEGLIDEVSIKDICNNSILLDQISTLKSLVVHGDVTFEKGGTVDGNIAGVNITFLNNAVVKSKDDATSIHGLKTFDTLTVDGDLHVQGKFGGIDIENLYDNYMSISRDQTIEASIHFEELLINGTLHANDFHTSDQRVNDINMQELSNTVLRTTGFQVINVTHTFDDVLFEGDVVVAGKVNGIQIPDGVMKRNRINYIHSPKIFQKNVHVLGDLQIDTGRKIQGVDLSDWSSKTVKKNNGTFKIDGNKTFVDLTAEDMIVNGLIDGVFVSEDNLLLSYGLQEVTGKKYVIGDVTFNDGLTVNGLVNTVNLTDLAKRAVRRDSNNTITGLKIFKKPLLILSLKAGLINGVDIGELQNQVNTDLDYSKLVDRLEELGTAISEMKTAVDKQAAILQYYELFQEFVITTAYRLLYVPTKYKEYLLMSDFSIQRNGCSSVLVYEYSESRKNFIRTKQALKSSLAIAMKALNVWNSTILITANSRPTSSCHLQSTMKESYTDTDYVPINIFYLLNGTFALSQSLTAKSATDLAAFEDGESVCFVYLEMVDVQVYCAPDVLHDFDLVETLRTKRGRKVDVIRLGDVIFLAVASINVWPGIQEYVDVYLWDKAMVTFGEPIQVIKSTHAESVLFLKRAGVYSTELFLLIAEGNIPHINNPRLFVYKYNSGNFYKYQEIVDSGELDWSTLPNGELIIFVLDVRTGEIRYYLYKGASGFVLSGSVTSVGAQTLHVFKRSNTEDNANHFLALAGLQSPVPSAWNVPDLTKIIVSKIQGRTASSISY